MGTAEVPSSSVCHHQSAVPRSHQTLLPKGKAMNTLDFLHLVSVCPQTLPLLLSNLSPTPGNGDTPGLLTAVLGSSPQSCRVVGAAHAGLLCPPGAQCGLLGSAVGKLRHGGARGEGASLGGGCP